MTGAHVALVDLPTVVGHLFLVPILLMCCFSVATAAMRSGADRHGRAPPPGVGCGVGVCGGRFLGPALFILSSSFAVRQARSLCGWTRAELLADGHVPSLCLVEALSYGMAMLSWLRAAISDPGYVDASDAQHRQRELGGGGRGGDRYCEDCAIWKPARTFHCKRSGRCVRRLDHYCLVTGRAVGALNLRYFLLWLLYQTLLCALLVGGLGGELCAKLR